MTQAFNLSQLANGVNTSGQLNAATYLYNQVPVANGGTGLSNLTAGYIPYGTGTGAFGSSANLVWDAANARLGVGTASPTVRFEVNGTAIISGNLGLGVTPSGWTLGKVLEIGTATGNAIWGVGTSNMNIVSNVYYDGAYKFAGTGSAGTLAMSGGGFAFASSTASGTAGGTISFTDILGASRGNTLYLQGASSQSGTGITFPATQNASSNANTLDDYEEGTFTPSITAGMTAITYVTQAGNYTKIGNLVVATCAVRISAATLNGSDLTIGGLPFTVSNATGSIWSGGIHYNSVITSGTGGICVTVQANSTTTKFNSFSGITYLGNNCASIGYLYFMVVYQAS